jgi:ribosomal small subunit protein bTHX
MGRGDKRTVKGKRTKGSFGVSRQARPWQMAKAKTRKPE